MLVAITLITRCNMLFGNQQPQFGALALKATFCVSGIAPVSGIFIAISEDVKNDTVGT